MYVGVGVDGLIVGNCIIGVYLGEVGESGFWVLLY